MNNDSLTQLAREAREGIKQMTSIGNAKCGYGECYIPSDEAIDAVIRSALEKAQRQMPLVANCIAMFAHDIEHGDEQHRQWLRDATKSWCENGTIPKRPCPCEQPKAEPWTAKKWEPPKGQEHEYDDRLWYVDTGNNNNCARGLLEREANEIAAAHNASIGAHASECNPNTRYSGICIRGTKGCDVIHPED